MKMRKSNDAPFSDFHLEVWKSLIEEGRRKPNEQAFIKFLDEIKELRKMLRSFANLHGLQELPTLRAMIAGWDGES